jgi:hypothetical protein
VLLTDCPSRVTVDYRRTVRTKSKQTKNNPSGKQPPQTGLNAVVADIDPPEHNFNQCDHEQTQGHFESQTGK